MKEPSQVYFIRPVGMDGPIKIGCSRLPSERLVALAMWSPFPLELVGMAPGSFRDERFLHGCFCDLHLHHEWFSFSPFLGETIDAILAFSIGAVLPTLPARPFVRARVKFPKRTLSQKRWLSFSSRARNIENRLRAENPKGRWRRPDDVERIMDRWRGARDRAPVHPTDIEIDRLDEYLSNPQKHSVVPSWDRRRISICIPVFDTAAYAEAA